MFELFVWSYVALMTAASEDERGQAREMLHSLGSRSRITTEQAAAVLGVSRPTVIRLVDAGKLPARVVGTHRRLVLGDVLAYRDASAVKRRSALATMTHDAEDLGLYG